MLMIRVGYCHLYKKTSEKRTLYRHVIVIYSKRQVKKELYTDMLLLFIQEDK